MKKTGFDAYDVAIEIAQEMKPIIESLKPRDPDLADEARRATRSIALNLREGRRRSGKDRLHHFRVASGSAHEVLGALDEAEVWEYVDAARTEKVRELLDREGAMLWSKDHVGRNGWTRVVELWV